LIALGGIVALAGSILPWYRPIYHEGGLSRPALLVINGLDTADGKIVAVLAVSALAIGLLILRGRGLEAKVAAAGALLAGLAVALIGAIDTGRGRSQFIALATKGLASGARAIERAVADRQFDNGGLSIQVRPGVVLVLLGGTLLVVGAVVGAFARARPSPLRE
jgi:hypothetical protein